MGDDHCGRGGRLRLPLPRPTTPAAAIPAAVVKVVVVVVVVVVVAVVVLVVVEEASLRTILRFVFGINPPPTSPS